MENSRCQGLKTGKKWEEEVGAAVNGWQEGPWWWWLHKAAQVIKLLSLFLSLQNLIVSYNYARCYHWAKGSYKLLYIFFFCNFPWTYNYFKVKKFKKKKPVHFFVTLGNRPMRSGGDISKWRGWEQRGWNWPISRSQFLLSSYCCGTVCPELLRLLSAGDVFIKCQKLKCWIKKSPDFYWQLIQTCSNTVHKPN